MSIILLLLIHLSCARVDTVTGRSLTCANVWVAPQLTEAFELAIERSPTFRGLLSIVQSTNDLRVSIAAGRCEARSQQCGGRTTFRRFGRRLSHAAVAIDDGADATSMLAHELAHVCQWISGHLRQATAGNHYLEEWANATTDRVGREISSRPNTIYIAPGQNRKRTPTTNGNVRRPLSLLMSSRPVPAS
jgi:hypothetical protein